MNNKAVIIIIFVAAALLVNLNCGSPEIKTAPVEVKKPAPPVKPAGFVMRPFHNSMRAEMKRAYEQADEVIMGEYTGSRRNDAGTLIYYFDDYSTFNRGTLAWEPPMKVLLPVQAGTMKPDVIHAGDFKRLSREDRIGICWDPDRDVRYVYLVEGKHSILFLRSSYDEQTNTNNRFLLDTYPVTDICNAKLVFDLMIADLTDR